MVHGPKPPWTDLPQTPGLGHAHIHHSVGLGRALLLSSFLLAACLQVPAQDLAPRAYVITPIHTNAVVLTWGYYNGGINFGGTVPITGATGSYSVPVISLFHTLNFFGRSANLTATLPYAVGTFKGEGLGRQASVYRSGLADASFRFSVNLLGGPAMPVQEFARWKQKTLLGVSLRVIAPTGQYDGTKLINWSINRWAFKPELGYSQRLGHWLLDGYGGVWLYTTNSAAFAGPAPQPQTQEPIGSLIRREFLVGRYHQPERCHQPREPASWLPARRHRIPPSLPPSFRQNQLQQRQLRSLRR
jgi:hypothetical protein